MLQRTMTAAVVWVLFCAAYGQNRPAMKGYVLYSWRQNGNWQYSLLPGTNRGRTYEEITRPANVIDGTSNLEAAIKRLPAGSEIFWQSDGPPRVENPVPNESSSFKHPSRKRINRIKKVCDKLGVKLTLVA